MRFLLTNLLLLVFITSASAHSPEEIYYRPIKTGKSDYFDLVLKNDTIRFFKGEWVQTEAKGKGNIVLGGEVLQAEGSDITNYKDRTADTTYAPLNLMLTASFDTVEVAYGGEEKISCIVINQSCNKIIDSSFLVPGKIVLSGLDSTDVLRFAPKNKASVIVKVSNIESYGVPVIIPLPPTPTPTINPLYLYIGVGVLVLVLVGVIVWFVMKRKRKAVAEVSVEAQEDSDTTVQANQVTKTTTDVKKETKKEVEKEALKNALEKVSKLDEKIKEFDKDLSEERKVVKKLKEENKALEDKLTRSKSEVKSLEDKLSSIKGELKIQHEKEIDTINKRIEADEKRHNEEIQKLKDINGELMSDLAKTSGILEDTKRMLSNTEDSLAKANDEITSAHKSLDKFTNILAEVPFAIEYADNVSKLIKVAEEINASALRMLDLDLDDAYNIMKYLTRYAKTLSMIDMQTLYAELKMLAKGNMVLVGSSLATYNKSNSAEDLKNSTIQYFFTSYLQKLVDGLVVLNESMAGADRLVDGVKAENVKVFADYRVKLQELCSLLGIVVENVCLFDKVGEKIDLRVELVDIGFSTGDIVDMENAIVYLQGTRRPETKVRVKAQE